uniref:DUF4371 domain-containing protein n=1 Tax=Tanacetum cinerariifolium TaxID=118510 RepID=A0A6L2P8Y3_TANCI|nr:hypothetical protein [Tanacetum cinerariifolium]GEU93415.1 hypothetical protein [Tanacetum cinerariifolium]
MINNIFGFVDEIPLNNDIIRIKTLVLRSKQGFIMAKFKTLESYFKRKPDDASAIANQENKRSRVSMDEPEPHRNQLHDEPPQHQNQSYIEPHQHQNQPESKTTEEMDSSDLERDPAKQKPMWDYPVNEREQYSKLALFEEVMKLPIQETESENVFVVKLETHISVMVDESRDESKKEQMAIVLRFVDTNRVIRERFLDLVHVTDTSAITLKTNLWKKLLQYEFDTSKIRGQGYDGASNMRREWNGLQAFICKDCPYAYYVNCFAHRLQLALVAAREKLMDDGSSCYAKKGDADSAYTYLKSFEFVFILHLMKEIMGKTNILCQALQKKSQDIFNAIELVSARKESLSEFKNNGWNSFFAQMRVFCEKHQIEIPDMSAPYKSTRYRPRKQDNHVTFEHYYRVDIFMSALDKQLYELNNRFSDQAMELLKLNSTLVPNRVFNIDNICLLVEKYYPADFTEQERLQLKYELELFLLKDKRTQS